MKKIYLAIFVSIFAFGVSFAQKASKSVTIFGDSYSTFEGFLTPEHNLSWYFLDRKQRDNDVIAVEQTWWHQLLKKNGWKLCMNNSYSGATIGYQGYDGNDYSPRTFIKRMRNLGDPDIILIFGGTNDSWAGEPVGEYKYEGWQYGDFYTYRPAMAYMLDWLKNHHPNVDIYVIINNDLRADITESTKTICDHYGITYIQLKDIDKISGHPSVKGMKAIAEQVAAVVCKR